VSGVRPEDLAWAEQELERLEKVFKRARSLRMMRIVE
jgi:5-bromo-4-chloroindolyl phosphate hydrolysis protein